MCAKQPHLIPEPLPPGVVLNEEQITELVDAGLLVTENTFDRRGLDACSYDVRVGRKGIIGGEGRQLDLKQDPLTLPPGGYAAVISHECVKIPPNMLVRINAKRSLAYQGLALLTGTQIDPGYEGHLLFGFYNTSSKKVVLAQGQPICSLVFEPLGAEVSRPKPPDPDLREGNFPARFVNEMANMEVLSWQQLSTEIRRLDEISKQIIELRAQYNNVLEPIKKQTENINKLSSDVDKLRESVGLLVEGSREHGKSIIGLGERVASLSVQGKIFWGILLLILGAVLALGLPRLLGSSSQDVPHTPIPQSSVR